MASTVILPLLGPTNKGTAVGIGLGGLAVAAFMIYRYEKKAKAQAAAVAASQQQQQQQAAQSAAGYGGYGNGYYGYGQQPSYYGYGASGGFQAGYYGYGTPTPMAAASTTNAQWTQAAISQLTQEGYSAQTVSAALGAYITGQTVTADQQAIIQAAISIEGYPPVPGANGYPPSIHAQISAGQGGGLPAGGQVAVPNVVGEFNATGTGDLEKAGLKPNPSPAGTGWSVAYRIQSQNPAAGTNVAPGSSVSYTSGKA